MTLKAIDTVNENTSTSKVYGFIVIIGIGAGMFIQSSFSVAQAKVTKARAADAAGFISLAQTLGIALSLAISGSIFQNKAIAGLQSVLPGIPISEVRGVLSGASSGLYQNLASDVRARVLAVIVDSMSYTYVLVITAGAMTIIGSLFMSVSDLYLINPTVRKLRLVFGIARATVHASSRCRITTLPYCTTLPKRHTGLHVRITS